MVLLVKRSKTSPPYQVGQWWDNLANCPTTTVYAGWLLLLLACPLLGCHQSRIPQTSAPAQSPVTVAAPLSVTPPPSQLVTPAVAGLVATLEDEQRDLPDGQIAWTTHWKLCWEPYAGAQEYELEPTTGEGVSRRRAHQIGTCLRVEVAKGQNAKAQGLFNRDLMLASLSGMLAYRVRAVMAEGRVSQWSPAMIVGQAGKPASSPPLGQKRK